MGALIERLSGRVVPLSDLEPNKDIAGLGMSDSYIYAKGLAEKFRYVNTYYHTAPFLDVTSPPEEFRGQFDFLISSDVMEHVAPPVETAFRNMRSLLKPGGVLVLTVPYTLNQETIEHFPNLHEYSIEGRGDSTTLRNVTRDGREEFFKDLVFHGGEGATLEMRLFSRRGLTENLSAAGFTDIRFHEDQIPEFGIVYFDLVSLPVTARA